MGKLSIISKQKIIEAAFQVINTLGYEKFTIREIAKHLGISTAAIYSRYSKIKEIYTDLTSYVDNKVIENAKKNRTGDSFLDIGTGMITFALEHKLIFSHFYLSNDKPFFNINKYTDIFITQMKRNPTLKVFDDERLKLILSDMRTFTIGLVTMICTEIETRTDLKYYQKKLEQLGHIIITYHILSTGNYEINKTMSFDNQYKSIVN